MTQTERLILENQIAIMDALFELSEVSIRKMDALAICISKTNRHLNESEQDGGH